VNAFTLTGSLAACLNFSQLAIFHNMHCFHVEQTPTERSAATEKGSFELLLVACGDFCFSSFGVQIRIRHLQEELASYNKQLMSGTARLTLLKESNLKLKYRIHDANEAFSQLTSQSCQMHRSNPLHPLMANGAAHAALSIQMPLKDAHQDKMHGIERYREV
jgi:hypothetical protein